MEPNQIVRNHIGDKQAERYNIPTDTKPVKNPPLVTIIWEDAISIPENWQTPNVIINTPEPTISTGWLWAKTDTHHTLITSINTTHIGGGIIIPNGCILHIHTHQTPQKPT